MAVTWLVLTVLSFTSVRDTEFVSCEVRTEVSCNICMNVISQHADSGLYVMTHVLFDVLLLGYPVNFREKTQSAFNPFVNCFIHLNLCCLFPS